MQHPTANALRTFAANSEHLAVTGAAGESFYAIIRRHMLGEVSTGRITARAIQTGILSYRGNC
jgi:hypothetical protein